ADSYNAGVIASRGHTQQKEDLGLALSEGRPGGGLPRPALRTMIAYAFLQHRRLATARREKKNQRATASTNIARRAPRHRRTHRPATTATMPALQKMDLQGKRSVNKSAKVVLGRSARKGPACLLKKGGGRSVTFKRRRRARMSMPMP